MSLTNTQQDFNPADPLTNQIQQLVSNALQLSLDQITPGFAFSDLPEWDSMGHMEIMLLLESEYGVEVSADTISTLTSIPIICSYLKEHNQ